MFPVSFPLNIIDINSSSFLEYLVGSDLDRIHKLNASKLVLVTNGYVFGAVSFNRANLIRFNIRVCKDLPFSLQ